jgi:hypothetical protein
MPLKICLFLSPAEGPPALARALRAGVPGDVACIALQRHADGESLGLLAESLEEVARRPVARLGKESLPLHGGALCLLGDGVDARVDGHRLKPASGRRLDLDGFLGSLAGLAGARVAVLPGREVAGTGFTGLSALQKMGLKIAAAAEDRESESWAASLEAAGLRLERRPLEDLFAFGPGPSGDGE